MVIRQLKKPIQLISLPNECRDNKAIGYRSTIGFDVSVH